MTTFSQLVNSNELFDSHTHLVGSVGKLDIGMAVSDARAHHVANVIDMSTTPKIAAEIAQQPNMPGYLKAIGIDPEVLIPGNDDYIGDISDEDFEKWLAAQKNLLISLVQMSVPAMIGECGVDMHWLQRQFKKEMISQAEVERSIERQLKLFRLHCELAEHYQLPLSVHSRKAEQMCLDNLADFRVTAVFHSYTGSYETAKQIFDKGHYLGLNGIVTYHTAGDIRKMYRKILGEQSGGDPFWFYQRHILFETDAPYLNPFDLSQVNQPAKLPQIFEYVQNNFNPVTLVI